MSATDCVLFEERACAERRIGIATLNAPRKLNALDLGMIERLQAQLLRWRDDPQIAAVVLCGTGERAFCAGGDVREVAGAARGKTEDEVRFAEHYFGAEYRLDYLIHTFGKPLLGWGEGIVMGGGIGLLVGASHRVVTPRSLLAMPEITIGLFPDVGASWFLNRMPGRSGLYLGVTGARLNAADAVFVGLADYVLADGRLTATLEKLTGTAWSEDIVNNHEQLSRLLAATPAEAAPSRVHQHLQTINRLTDHPCTTDLYRAIIEGPGDDAWLTENAERLRAGSPTSVWVIQEQLRRGRRQSLAENLRMEADMAVQFTRRHDFPEGVRALLVDKDNRPNWQPGSLEAVEPAQVAAHFVSPWPQSEHPLRDLQ
jgi:enoyl-CoA hydratase/carnithine racemase